MKSTRPFFATFVCSIAFLYSGEVDARIRSPEPIDVEIEPVPGTTCHDCYQMMCPCALCPDGIHTEGCCGGCVIQDDGTCGPEPPTNCPVVEPPPPLPPLCYEGQNECGTVGGGQCAGLNGPCQLCSPYGKEMWGYGCDEKCRCNDDGTCSNFKPQSMCPPVFTPPTCIEGEIFGEPGKDCPALRCACQECPYSKKVWGCCGKCYCAGDGIHLGYIPKETCLQVAYDSDRLDASP